METSNTNSVNVSIVRMGRTEQIEVSLDEGATVGDAFEAASIDFDSLGRDTFCEGVKCEKQFVVNDGDVLSIVAEKVEAGKGRLHLA